MFNGIYNIISQCLSSSTITFSHARQSHAHILKLELYDDTYIATRLLSHYANNLYFSQVTNLVLHFFSNPTLPSFTTILNAFVRSHEYDVVLCLFSLMGHKGLALDGFLLPSAIKACAALQALKPRLQFHGYFLAEIEGAEQKSYSAEKGLLMLLDSDLSALGMEFLELQESKWRSSNCVGK